MRGAGDMELVRDYVRLKSDAAFAELVQRHINLVYSVALRQVGNPAQAEEITQAVFVILARKAPGLSPDLVLGAWLHETTRLASLSFLRGERRRQLREQEAYMQSTLQPSTDGSTWHQLSPLLDEAMGRLGKKDRDAVILRFFEEQGVREVAARLQISEAAAQRRVLRALEKLRIFFAKRGVTSTTAVLAGAISANSVQAAPVALAKTVTAIALAKGAAASTSTLTLIKGALKIMAWTKAKTVIVVGAALVLAGGTATIVVKNPEPLYRGRPLSYWLKGFDIGYNGPAKPSFDESVAAVRQTSTNALPILLRMLRTRDSDLKHRLARLAQKQRVIKINYVTADRQRWAGRQGFMALGPYAKTAIPQLVEISQEETSRAEWHKYATEILDLLKETSPNQQGAANGSQPIRSETNSTSSAAGSRR